MADLRKKFHDVAVAVTPVELGAFDFCVAILAPGKSLNGCQSSDFLWFKCRGKHSIKIIESHYATRTGQNVLLRQGDFIPPPSAQMQNLNDFGDNVIVFSAVERLDKNTTLATGRPPLEPVNVQASAKPANVGTSANLADAKPVTEHSWGKRDITSPLCTTAKATQTVKKEPGNAFIDTNVPKNSTTWQPESNAGVRTDRVTYSAEGAGHAVSKAATDCHPIVKNEQQPLALADSVNNFAPVPGQYIEDPFATAQAGNANTPLQGNAQWSWDPRYHYHSIHHPSMSASNPPANAAVAGFDRATSLNSNSPQTLLDRELLTYLRQQANLRMPTNLLNHTTNHNTPSAPTSYTPFVKQEANHEKTPQGPLVGLEPVETGKVANAKVLNSAQNDRLQKILKQGTPEDLEAEVQHCLLLLDQLNIPIAALAVQDPEAQRWSEQITNLRKENISQPTVIGVVGNTGAGKSSIINALLDEERLVPTNCMRACTATVSTLSWNSSEDENAKYGAEVEFIQPEDWQNELHVLFAEVLDGSGKISREVYTADSEAGIAYAKIRAVYPEMTKDEIANSSVAELMEKQVVKRLLGTTRKIEEARASVFYKKLQRYIDSQEKSTDENKKERREMEFWPLIKVVKIYTKSDCLSTGAVIVDLPGVHDANAARAAVASSYMKQCTGLFICAPINRAVDDKAAKSLLGDSFKRQLKYDGTYSRVTFICSKTDDISITEASDSLGLGDEMSEKWETVDQIERDIRRLKKQLTEFKESKSVFGDVLNDTDDQLEIWDKLKDDLDDGRTVYAPRTGSKKRKRSNKISKSRKKRSTESGSETEDDNSTASEDDNDDGDPQEAGDPLTEEAVDEKIAEFRATKKEARVQRRDIDLKIQSVNDEVKSLEVIQGKIEAEMSAICISGRNKYSKGAIRQDFAAGIRELDQENAAEEDEANFNPEEDFRDYEEVARSLPVFCVSSRAYQQMSGRLQRDKPVPGFTALEETEIPQLQAHCKKLTENGRAATCRRFLNSLSQLINSLTLWSSLDASFNLTDSQMAAEGRFLKSKLAALEKGLEKSVQACLEEMKESLSENIYEKFDEVIAAAVAEANATAYKWSAPVNRENRAAGGLYWATYKAVVRRNGVFSNAQGVHDFNSQLTDPIMKQLASDWEKAFARRLPSVLATFTKSTQTLLQSFHKDVESRAMERGTGIAGISMLGQQLHTHGSIFQDLTAQMVEVINNFQREANREFTPVIANHLASAYAWCSAESGPGQYVRMKEHMSSHVEVHKQTMFAESTEEVKKRLNQMCRDIEEAMSNKAHEVFSLLQRDYMTVITGAQLKRGAEMPKWQRIKIAEVAKIIDDIEAAATEETKVEEEDVVKETQREVRVETNADASVVGEGESEDGYISAEEVLHEEI